MDWESTMRTVERKDREQRMEGNRKLAVVIMAAGKGTRLK